MKNIIFLITGFTWVVYVTLAENCPDPAWLHPTSINTQAIISVGILDGIDLYVCSITKVLLRYECNDSKLGNILHTTRDISTISSRYFQGDTINFMFEYDTKTYTIKLNETEKTYLYTLSGESVPSNGSCVGKLDKNQSVIDILNVTITMRVSYMKKRIYLLPEILLKQTIMQNCSYSSGYCFLDNTQKHNFWKVAAEVTPGKNILYGYAIFDDVHVYTMSKTPLLQYLLLKQNSSYVAMELVKESSYFPNSSLTYWQTDYQVNVSFHHYFKAMFSLQTRYKQIKLKIGGSREEAFNRMRTRCGLQQLEQKLKVDHDTSIDCDYYFPLFVIYMVWSLMYTMFNVVVNYCTLRKLGDQRLKIIFCAISHATTNRYLYKHQHREKDDLNVTVAMMNIKMESRFEHLEHLMQVMETTNRVKSTDDTYDYIRVSKLKDERTSTDVRVSSKSIGDKSVTEEDKVPDELFNLEDIKIFNEYITPIHPDANPESVPS